MALTNADLTALATQETAVNTAQTAHATAEVATNTAAMRDQLGNIGFGLDRVKGAVDALKVEMGWRLAEQSELLREQNEWAQRQAQLLGEIAGMLSRPDYTKAVERLRTAWEMIDHGRHERALAAARSAIDLAPYDPFCYRAAGWAAALLGDLEQAEQHFTEAVEFAGGDADLRAQLLRQTASVAYARGEIERALEFAHESLATAAREEERIATMYELALFKWAHGDRDAPRPLIEACERDSRYCELALSDKRLVEAGELRLAAIKVESDFASQVAERKEHVRRQLHAIRDRLGALPAPAELADSPLPPPSLSTHRRLADFVRSWQTHESWVDDQPHLQGALSRLDQLDDGLSSAPSQVEIIEEEITRHEADVPRYVRAQRLAALLGMPPSVARRLLFPVMRRLAVLFGMPPSIARRLFSPIMIVIVIVVVGVVTNSGGALMLVVLVGIAAYLVRAWSENTKRRLEEQYGVQGQRQPRR